MTSALNLDHVRKVFPAQNHPNSKLSLIHI